MTGLPFDFVGDFVFQVKNFFHFNLMLHLKETIFQKSRRDERANVIEAIVARCIDYFHQARGEVFPQRVIIYRNGCSEGQFANVRNTNKCINNKLNSF